LTFGENADSAAELFMDRLAIVESAGFVLSLVIVDNRPTQCPYLEYVLYETLSPMIHHRCFAYMANLILSQTIPSANFARSIAALSEIQSLLRRKDANELIGAKCLRFIRARWF
jgi:hypothetical protein